MHGLKWNNFAYNINFLHFRAEYRLGNLTKRADSRGTILHFVFLQDLQGQPLSAMKNSGKCWDNMSVMSVCRAHRLWPPIRWRSGAPLAPRWPSGTKLAPPADIRCNIRPPVHHPRPYALRVRRSAAARLVWPLAPSTWSEADNPPGPKKENTRMSVSVYPSKTLQILEKFSKKLKKSKFSLEKKSEVIYTVIACEKRRWSGKLLG